MIFLNEKIKYVLSRAISHLSDEHYCKVTFLLKHGRLPNVQHPSLFNEKLLYLKLNTKLPIMKKLVDKYDVRAFIESCLGKEFLIPLIGVYNSPNEVDFEALPQKFVLKLTAGSQNNIICLDKNTIDWELTSRKIVAWLEKDSYMRTREWQYKDLLPRFVIEEYIEDSNGKTHDYKFWCFNGEPKFVQIDTDRFGTHKRSFFDLDSFKELDVEITYPKIDSEFHVPVNMSQMIEISRTLSKDFSFMRVDLYNIDGKIYFGEMTFYPGNCNERISPTSYEKVFGDMLNI